ncbi:MAG: hypothetical protein J6Y52_06170 [Bacteroidales bacterium]|nr:hypothetical protein [Bacteroidales bacterium]
MDKSKEKTVSCQLKRPKSSPYVENIQRKLDYIKNRLDTASVTYKEAPADKELRAKGIAAVMKALEEGEWHCEGERLVSDRWTAVFSEGKAVLWENYNDIVRNILIGEWTDRTEGMTPEQIWEMSDHLSPYTITVDL